MGICQTSHYLTASRYENILTTENNNATVQMVVEELQLVEPPLRIIESASAGEISYLFF